MYCPVCSHALSKLPELTAGHQYVSRKCRFCKTQWHLSLPPKQLGKTHIIGVEIDTKRVGLEAPTRTETP